jgi:hypothetical protein
MAVAGEVALVKLEPAAGRGIECSRIQGIEPLPRTQHAGLTASNLLALHGQQLAHGQLLVTDRAHGQRVGDDGAQMRQRLRVNVLNLGSAGEIGKGIKGVGHDQSGVFVLQG